MATRILLVSIVGFVAGMSEAAGDCAGGVRNGQTLERGRYFYQCTNGALTPKGCLTDDRQQIAVSATFDRTTVRFRCVLNADQSLSLVAEQCLDRDGRAHRVAERWRDSRRVVRVCQRDPDGGLRATAVGCSGSDGSQVDIGQWTVSGDRRQLCKQTSDGEARLTDDGCSRNGVGYKVGETFDEKNAWFNCTIWGVRVAGCRAADNGKRLTDGERLVIDRAIFDCIVENGDARLRPIGCADGSDSLFVERRLGCTWVDGRAPLQYEMICKLDAQTGRPRPRKLRCNYRLNNSVLLVEPGEERLIERRTMVFCDKTGVDDLTLRVEQRSD